MLALLVLLMIVVVGHGAKRAIKGRIPGAGIHKSTSMLPGLHGSALGRCAERSDSFDGKTGRCRLSNGVAYAALALQDWVGGCLPCFFVWLRLFAVALFADDAPRHCFGPFLHC